MSGTKRGERAGVRCRLSRWGRDARCGMLGSFANRLMFSRFSPMAGVLLCILRLRLSRLQDWRPADLRVHEGGTSELPLLLSLAHSSNILVIASLPLHLHLNLHHQL